MTELSYVRTQMLDEKAPPASGVGIIGWMRNNLFSSVLNTILTLAAIYSIYLLLAGLLPWVFQGVWTGGSLSACRAVVGAVNGEGADAACWAVINERFRQLVFGFYPADLYWRPILAFVGVFVAIAPILFDRLPRKNAGILGTVPVHRSMVAVGRFHLGLPSGACRVLHWLLCFQAGREKRETHWRRSS